MFRSRMNWEKEIKNIQKMFSNFKTLKEVGDVYSVSRQRIKQVCQKYGINTTGKKELRKVKEKQYSEKWGNKEDSDLYRTLRAKFRSKKAQAIRNGTPFDLNFGDLSFPTHCPILGLKINYFADVREETSPSFDRFDSSKGYVHGNVQIISWRANRIKNDGTAEEHRKIAEYIEKG